MKAKKEVRLVDGVLIGLLSRHSLQICSIEYAIFPHILKYEVTKNCEKQSLNNSSQLLSALLLLLEYTLSLVQPNHNML